MSLCGAQHQSITGAVSCTLEMGHAGDHRSAAVSWSEGGRELRELAELEQLTALVAWMKDNGVLHLKTPKAEILLGVGHLPPPRAPAGAGKNGRRSAVVTERDLQFAATEGLPDPDAPEAG